MLVRIKSDTYRENEEERDDGERDNDLGHVLG